MARLKGKTALITGAGSGVGRACLGLFAQEGADVFGVSRTEETLKDAVDEIADAPGNSGWHAADLSTEKGAQAAFGAMIEKFGRLDILVNCAGVGYSWAEKSPGSMDPIDQTSPDKWHEVMAINLDSVYYLCRLAIPRMREQGGGTIVNVASISGLLGLPTAHTYTAAKGAVINLTRSLATTYITDNIRSNCVAPGLIATPMVETLLKEFEDPAFAEAITPMKRPGTPEEIANGCLFLASDEASYCNGSVLVIDGGTAARQ